MINNRKIFYLDDDKNKPIMAGGVIIYRILENGDLELLLIDSIRNFEDLGGKTSESDKNIFETVTREAFEESNEILNKIKIRTRIKKAEYVYTKKNKYIVYIIKATNNEKNLVSKEFGNKEYHDNIIRKIKWVNFNYLKKKEIFNNKLNWRIKNGKLFSMLDNIQNKYK
jgi:hypothetical protein